jgi:hypothetical protein
LSLGQLPADFKILEEQIVDYDALVFGDPALQFLARQEQSGERMRPRGRDV